MPDDRRRDDQGFGEEQFEQWPFVNCSRLCLKCARAKVAQRVDSLSAALAER